MVLDELIAAARQTLVCAGFRPEDAAFDAEVLARHVLGWDMARLFAHNLEPAPVGFAGPFAAAIERRTRHEPVALITGHREFWGRDFIVTPATLVPRPETEIIIEEALQVLPMGPSSIIDIGTGSGCLAVSLAVERPAASVVATDVSHAALLVAASNAHHHNVADRVRFVRTDLVAGIRGRADLIVSNPPYVPETSATALPEDVVRYEPATALFGGRDGLAVISRLFAMTPALLAPGGTFIIEFGFGQEDGVRTIADRHGWQVRRIVPDLQGIPRTMVLGMPLAAP
jgi:release factor glutamine methyltransferase